MKKLQIYREKNRIILNKGENYEVIFKYSDYKKAIRGEEYRFFDRINSLDKLGKQEKMEERLHYLFNLIMVNNMTNYILDQCKEEEIELMVFDKKIKESQKQIVKFRGILDLEDSLGNLIICLINSDAYLNGEIKIDYGDVKVTNEKHKLGKKTIEEIFYYQKKEVKELLDKLRLDLLAYGFVKEGSKNEEDRYILPIYVDEKSLIEKGLGNFQDYLVNWTSLAYIKMLVKIHDFFMDIYKLEGKKGLENDDLLIALIAILDYEIKEMPAGLEKSIEVGRAVNGKCHFIDGIEGLISLPQEIALSLQARDAFGVTSKFFTNRS